jgi:enoyl-CoA hydratase/carnithine racemase
LLQVFEGALFMPSVIVEKKDRIGTLTLNRPEVMNALDMNLILELEAAVTRMGTDEEIHVVILKGAGSHFCSGADLNLLADDIEPEKWLLGMRHLGAIVTGLREIPQPVITVLRGVAVGGGANLALAGDFVIASEETRFSEVFVHIGVILDGGGTYFLPRLLGLAKARELALLGDEIDGRKAADIGLVHQCVPEKDLDPTVDQLAATLAQKSRMAMSLIKEGLEKSFDMTLRQAMEWEASHQAIMLQTAEHKAIVRGVLAAKEAENDSGQ